MRIDKFTNQFQKALSDAQSLANKNDNSFVEPEHVVFSLATNEEGILHSLFENLCTDLNSLKTKLLNLVEDLPKVLNSDGELIFSRNLNNLLNLSEKEALKKNYSYISPEFFILAISKSSSKLAKLLNEHGLEYSQIQKVLEKYLEKDSQHSKNSKNKSTFLHKYTIDLTLLAKNGKLDPVIGRDDEIRRCIQILQRRRKNNPVLIGQPGVGKTAIIEGLAQRIVNSEVPETLKNKKVLVLDMALLLAGAKYRGEFEERLKKILNEIVDKVNEYIIFIDEMHSLVGTGKAEGALDAGNMLKPSLARGELHCIGATTLDEFKKNIEKDPALERRFQKIIINEPSVENTIAILRGLKEKYEVHHGVEISDPAIVSAAELSHRYISDRFLPDKAIDLIDEAAARIKIEIDSKPEEMDILDRKIIQLRIEKEAIKKEHDELSAKRILSIEADLDLNQKKYANLNEIWKSEKIKLQNMQLLKENLEKEKIEIENLKREGNWQKLSEIQYSKIPKIESKIKDLESLINSKNKLLRTEVGSEEIASVISRTTGIPISKMLSGEKKKLIMMEEYLSKRLIGQDHAISIVSNAIRRSRSGLSDETQPYGSFLFLGPTGVGKTELCKTLADFLFDSEDQIVRIDMSEFMEKHSVARLIGAPPGYIGYEEGGFLTELVRRKPYCVVLFDEVEKAHPEVFNILLQVLDDGRLTDSHGRTVNFKNTVIIMTSNLGTNSIKMNSNDSSTDMEKNVLNDVKKHFRPEFINRVDEIIIFNSLNSSNINKIISLQLDQLRIKLDKMSINISFTESTVKKILKDGFNDEYGARPIKRQIKNLIETPISMALLKGDISSKGKYLIDCKDERIFIKKLAT